MRNARATQLQRSRINDLPGVGVDVLAGRIGWRHGLMGLAAACLALTLGCGEKQHAAEPPARPQGAPVKVTTIKKQAIHRSVTLVGTVEPWKRSIVASEIAGRVVNFPVEEGDAVERNQVLARLNTETLEIQLDSATASRQEAYVRYKQAQKDLERVAILEKKELVTKKEYDDAAAEVDATRQRLRQLEAEIRGVKDQIDKSTIRAPFAGWVTMEHTEVGQWLGAGSPVVEMVDLSRVQVEVPLPERYVGDLGINDQVTAVFDGLPGFETQGHVVSIVVQADRSARTFPVKVEIPNPSLTIKSGMVARLTLHIGQPYAGLVVPKDALVLRGSKQFIFIVQDGKSVQIPVTPNVYTDGLVEIKGDVREGMQVVIEGNERLLPGRPVSILNES